MSMPPDTNTDERSVPTYRLPELLAGVDAQRITTVTQWRTRRAELLECFSRHVYGRTPAMMPECSWLVVETADDALAGTARRIQAELTIGEGPAAVRVDVLIYVPLSLPVDLPKAAPDLLPVFIGLNFAGNHSVEVDPAIRISPRWRGDEMQRGLHASSWQAAMVVARGYALVTACYHDLAPDMYAEDFSEGLHPLFYQPGQVRPADDEWGQIGVWAWGLSRLLDALLRNLPELDPTRIALTGHSRLGKTALWAAAQDERFALVICNQSGTGGAALWRRRFGERLHHFRQFRIMSWFCADLQRFAQREDELPVDQHQLLALIAPRPLYVSCAAGDPWGDPHGSFLACRAASPAWNLLGRQGLPDGPWPAEGCGLVGDLAYHQRPGTHDVLAEDWTRFLNFTDHQFGRRSAGVRRVEACPSTD